MDMVLNERIELDEQARLARLTQIKAMEDQIHTQMAANERYKQFEHENLMNDIGSKQKL